MAWGSLKDTDRCVTAVQQLDLPQPFSLAAFVDRVAAKRGRPIDLVPAALGSAPCGMLICTTDVDYIVYATNTSQLHAQHIVFHEIGHLELDHAIVPTCCADLQPQPSVDDLTELDALQMLLPDLSPALIRRVLNRTPHRSAAEYEAERFATLLALRVGGCASAQSQPDDQFGDALVSIFGALNPTGSHG